MEGGCGGLEQLAEDSSRRARPMYALDGIGSGSVVLHRRQKTKRHSRNDAFSYLLLVVSVSLRRQTRINVLVGVETHLSVEQMWALNPAYASAGRATSNGQARRGSFPP